MAYGASGQLKLGLRIVDGIRAVLQGVKLALCLVMLTTMLGSAAKAQGSPVDAFSKFVRDGDYNQANHYLANKWINPADVDTAQLFYDVFTNRYSRDILANAGAIDTLYNYLNAIGPINFNRAMACGYEKKSRCLLVNHLFSGARQEPIAYFVDRGLDPNYRASGIVPATVPLLMRIGSTYGIEDLNFIVSKGLTLGADTYAITELASYREEYADDSYQLTLPANYLTLQRLNMLDMLVIALATRVKEQAPMQSLRRRTLCEFIAYAAPSFTPTFDYLSHVLDSIPDFRGANVGRLEQRNNRREVYEPFPEPCVTLVQNMAVSHGNLGTVINRFAGEGDTATANWFISILNSQQQQ